MRREHTQIAYAIGVIRPLGLVALTAPSRKALEQLDRGKCRVAFVQMVRSDIKTKRFEYANTAHAQQQLLLEPVFFISAIEIMREIAVSGVVLFEIGIEKQHGDCITDIRLVHVQPRAHPYIALFDPDADHRSERLSPAVDVPRIRVLDLPAFGVDLLPEVARAAEQRHEHDGKLQIRTRAHGVAREYTETAGVRVDLNPQGELHREIRDVGLWKESAQFVHLVRPYSTIRNSWRVYTTPTRPYFAASVS
jgi:hypothetical protein